jgi:hypothetical protein
MGDPVRDPARLMEVLSRIADASRILPSLMRLLRHQNPRLRSKVVKLIGRGSGSVKWIRAKLSEADPRVRANALEALWGVDTPEARALLLFSTKDANNRVLGNALIGLYYLGDSSVLEEIVKLSAHESALFRATAAWVMGETGDVRFSDIVRRLLLQQDPLVRKRALVALGRIKQANAEPGEPPWRISGSFETSPKIDGPRRVMAAVASIGAAELKRIAPIHFVLCEGGRYVTSYKVNEKPLADAINVIFIIPRTAEPGYQPFVEGILSCLQWKRPGDRWCLLPYAEDGDSGPAPESPLVHPLQYISEAKALETSLRQSAGSPDCGDLWGAIFRATRSETLSSRSRRHVIVLSRAQENRSAGNTLVTNAENGRAGVRVISSVQNPNLAAFCGRTHSQYRQALEEEIPEIVRDAYLSFLARYEITYQPVAAQAATLKLRVQSPDGWAETLVPIPPPE